MYIVIVVLVTKKDTEQKRHTHVCNNNSNKLSN